MTDHRHARFFLHALDETASATRHDDVDGVGHAREHVTNGCPVGGWYDLNRGLRQAGGAQSGDQARVNRAARIRALGAAAQNDCVAGFQAQRTGISGNVRPTLVDDTHHAERHAHALDAQAIRSCPRGDDDTDRIVQRCNFFNSLRHGCDALLVERQSIHHGVGQRALPRRLQIAAIRFQNRGALLANLRGSGGERRVLRRSSRSRERA